MCSHEYRQVNRAGTICLPLKNRLRDRHGTTTNGVGKKRIEAIAQTFR